MGAASFCAAAVAVIRQVIDSAVARPEIPSDARTAKERGQKRSTDEVRLSSDTKRESFLQEVMSRIIGVYKIQSYKLTLLPTSYSGGVNLASSAA